MLSFTPIVAPSKPILPPPPASTQTPPSTILPLPQILSYPSQTPSHLLTQGAEALLFKSTYLLPTLPCALKYRPSKPYRHPTLDARLTKHRILSEARVLVRCRREGVPVPAVYALDEAKGWICLEWIRGEVVRIRVNEWLDKEKGGNDGGDGEGFENALRRLMGSIGRAVGRLHAVGIVHGDLTTSNLMLRDDNDDDDNGESGKKETNNAKCALEGEVILIDFGLASQSSADEDRAVDLYVLERAFGSTHPRAERFFVDLLTAYGESFKGAKVVLRRLEDVRMRGRKKSMLG